jgi:hypothetical protein
MARPRRKLAPPATPSIPADDRLNLVQNLGQNLIGTEEVLCKFILPREMALALVDMALDREVSPSDVARMGIAVMLRVSKPLELHDKMKFGKYSGEILETIIKIDPEYIDWAISKVERFSMTKEAHNLLNSLFSGRLAQQQAPTPDSVAGRMMDSWDRRMKRDDDDGEAPF